MAVSVCVSVSVTHTYLPEILHSHPCSAELLPLFSCVSQVLSFSYKKQQPILAIL